MTTSFIHYKAFTETYIILHINISIKRKKRENFTVRLSSAYNIDTSLYISIYIFYIYTYTFTYIYIPLQLSTACNIHTSLYICLYLYIILQYTYMIYVYIYDIFHNTPLIDGICTHVCAPRQMMPHTFASWSSCLRARKIASDYRVSRVGVFR